MICSAQAKQEALLLGVALVSRRNKGLLSIWLEGVARKLDSRPLFWFRCPSRVRGRNGNVRPLTCEALDGGIENVIEARVSY